MHSDPSRPGQKPHGQGQPTASRPTVSPRRRGAETASRVLAAAAGTSFAARYSDGRTAVAHTARVSIDDRGLAITLGDGTPGDGDASTRLLWPLVSLRTAQPLTWRSTDVLVGRIGDETETLFVADPAFARALAAAAPALTARHQRWRHVRPWVAVTAVIGIAALVMAQFDLSPARAVARVLPEAARQRMGEEAIRSMTKGHAVCSVTAGRAALDRMTSRLTGSLPAAEAGRFKVVVVDWGLMNAFAVPGGQIVLTRGLLAKAESSDEVAGVLAHEMGHGIELHPEAAMVRALGMTAVADLLFGSGTVTNIGLMLAELSYSRGAERQADMQGLGLLRKAGISPQGLADFFRRVMKTEGRNSKSALPGRTLDVLSTHPATDERIHVVERQPPYPATPALSSEDWTALRGICGAAAASPLPSPKTVPKPAPKTGPAPDAGTGDGQPKEGQPKAGTTPKPPNWGTPAPTPAPGKPPASKPAPPPANPAPAPGSRGERPIDL